MARRGTSHSVSMWVGLAWPRHLRVADGSLARREAHGVVSSPELRARNCSDRMGAHCHGSVTSMSMLEFSNVSLQIGNKIVLRDCTFSVPRASLYALLGPNGAGKTTTLRLAVGLYRPTTGVIRVNGWNVLTQADKVQEITGYCADVPFLYEFLTGREFLYFLGRLRGIPPRGVDARIAEAMPVFGLHAVMDRPIREYSRGMRQKLGIWAAALHHPQLLLLDEPLTAVDTVSRERIIEWLRDYRRHGGTVVFATHDRALARELGATCLFIKDGVVVQEGA